MIKWLAFLLLPLVKWVKHEALDSKLAEVKALAKEYRNATKDIAPVYTTIKTYMNGQDEYWNWAKTILANDKFHFMLFQIRENVIREMIADKEGKASLNHVGRLETLNIIPNYLRTGIQEYEDSLRRIKENTERE